MRCCFKSCPCSLKTQKSKKIKDGKIYVKLILSLYSSSAPGKKERKNKQAKNIKNKN